MSGISNPPSALIISNDQELIDLLKTSNTTDQEFKARQSIQLALEDSNLLSGNGIVIIDLAVNDNDVSATISQLVRLKRHDPSQVLIVVGDPVPLGKILKSNIQPLVYRAFNKPIHPKQIFLAFDHANRLHDEQVAAMAAGTSASSVGPTDRPTDSGALSSNRQKSSMLYLAVGLMAAGILGWFFFGTEAEIEPEVAIEGTVVIEDLQLGTPPPEDSQSPTPVEQELGAVKELNIKAANAFADGRFVSPAGDNALEYYQQALTLDPYDAPAYQGKASIAGAMRDNYQLLVDNAEFDKALTTINKLQEIEPLNQENDKLHNKLTQSIEAYASQIQNSGTPEQINKATAILNKMETSFDGSKSAAAALIKEQGLIKQIDNAIGSGNLVPPGKNNAYSLVSASLRNNAISKAHSTPRVAILGAKLLEMANQSLQSSDIQDAEKLAGLVRKLNAKSAALTDLNEAIIAKKKAAAEVERERSEKALALAQKTPEQTPPEEGTPEVIINPAVVIKRPSPNYPRAALNRNISGWVDLAFTIDLKGKTRNVEVVASEPSGIFNDVAIRAVKRWEFKPAKIQSTGEIVESKIDKTRLNFKLTD